MKDGHSGRGHLLDRLRQRRRIHSLFDDGQTVKDISDDTGLSERTVIRELRRSLPMLFEKSEIHRWVDRAICTPDDNELFYPTVNGRLAGKLKAQAIELCNMCPVKLRCRQEAFRNHEIHGVWGGVDMSMVTYTYDERTGKISAFTKVG